MKKILVLDVETANDTEHAIVYDIGYKIIDLNGKVYVQRSFVIRDTFVYMRDVVNQAFYAHKIPEYVNDIRNGSRTMVDFMQARNTILNDMRKFNCYTVAAYNCNFDRNALNVTLRYLTKSAFRFYFPFNVRFVDIWNMACNTICQSSDYKTFAETYRHYSNHGKNYKSSAEVVYQFLTNDPLFEEEHKGLDDVNIECEIMLHCLNNGGSMMPIKRTCWQLVKRAALVVAR